MPYLIGALLTASAIEAAALGVLIAKRRRLLRAGLTLRKREERFRFVTDGAPVMLWTARPDSTLDYLNSTCSEFTGLPNEQLVDNGWQSAVHPEDLEGCVRTYMAAFAARKAFSVEYRLRRADGAWRWLLDSGVPKFSPEGVFEGYIGSCTDITEQKEGEERIRESRAELEASHREVKQLAGRLIEAQDGERARIARDLHDDVSQQLAGLSIALSNMKRRVDELHLGDELQADLRALHQRATMLAQNVRNLSHDLHPTVLRHGGLVATLTSHCAELQRVHGTLLTCSAEGDFDSLPPEIALCLYRIAQEALRNVIAHSGADRAAVRLARAGALAEITITDDGRGFDVESSLERGKGLGLVSIIERVRLARGVVDVAAKSGKGTRVCVQIPAASPDRSGAGVSAESGQRELTFS